MGGEREGKTVYEGECVCVLSDVCCVVHYDYKPDVRGRERGERDRGAGREKREREREREREEERERKIYNT